jgi:homoserine kinase
MWVRAYGPACVGNVAAGFDVIGAAIAPDEATDAAGAPPLWGDLVEAVEIARGAMGPRVRLVCGGPFASELPADPAANVALAACRAFERRLGRPLPPLELRLDKRLPVGSGLGSSSATVVAVVRALDALLGGPLDDAQQLAAAGEGEAHAAGAVHLDNVAAALLGGLRLVDPGGGACRLPFPDELRFVLVSPALSLTTRVARAALPAAVPLAVAVAHAQNLGSLVHALHAGDRALIRRCLRDLLAEPYRAGLVPGFHAVQAAGIGAGAWGCSFSGAGPAVFAVAELAAAPAVGEAMRWAWSAVGVESQVRICALDRLGARVLEAGSCN